MKRTNHSKRFFAFAILLAASALTPATATVQESAQESIEIRPAPTTSASVESATAAADTANTTSPTVADPVERKIIRRIPYVKGDEMPEVGENEGVMLNPERTEWRVYRTDEEDEGRIKHTLPMLYWEGGSSWMNVITLCLIGMLFAAWKAPRWVKEIGLLAIFTGFLSMMVGLYGVFDFIQSTGYSVSFSLLSGGLRVALIAPLYGTIVYMISLLLRIALKPRL